MKQRILSILAIVLFVTVSSFANPFNGFVNPGVTNAFAARFKEARQVSWSRSEVYLKAQFELNSQVMFAYFTPTGEYLGQSRNISSFKLPVNLQSALKEDHAKEWISELFEYANDSETVYFAILENADTSIYLKSDGSNGWSIYKKVKKS